MACAPLQTWAWLSVMMQSPTPLTLPQIRGWEPNGRKTPGLFPCSVPALSHCVGGGAEKGGVGLVLSQKLSWTPTSHTGKPHSYISQTLYRCQEHSSTELRACRCWWCEAGGAVEKESRARRGGLAGGWEACCFPKGWLVQRLLGRHRSCFARGLHSRFVKSEQNRGNLGRRLGHPKDYEPASRFMQK